MPNIKSAKKALRQSIKKKVRNLKKRGVMKDAIKEIKKLVLQKKIEEAKKLIPKAQKAIDKAAKTGIIKKNNANRKKSLLSKLTGKS